jgi:large subunit ribosomal protein L10
MRSDKHFLLDEVTEFIEKFDAFFVMRYTGLKANLANDFRREVLKRGGDVHMMRKRLLLKATESVGINLEGVPLDGHIGIIFASEDPVAMSKALIQFGKENNEAVQLVGGHVEKQVFDARGVVQFAALPSKPEMQAQLLGTFEAPLSQTLAVFEALVTSVVYCLDNKVKQQSEEQSAVEEPAA